ncbi:hypothetical protein [Martelella sp. HB161492]|uniref:hypothetical protein n=1 Tax=Martelella sp. HB161492 TaxID=2720726 RepID=UPI001590203D|nr:hypothetical protein [Martelella sp. HB161492]
MTADYTSMLLKAYEDGTLIDQEAFASITPDEAVDVQLEVMRRRGQTPGAFKVAINGEGKAVASVIHADRVVKTGGALKLPKLGLIGIEFELGFYLAKTVTPEMAKEGEAAVLAAIDHFVFGMEVVGSRFANQPKATAWAQLADNLSGEAYVIGTERFDGGAVVDGAPLVLTASGTEIYNKPAKHPFGDAVKPVIAYALSGEDKIGMLKAGSFITTGSLCGGVPFTAPCEMVGTIFDQFSVSVSLSN